MNDIFYQSVPIFWAFLFVIIAIGLAWLYLRANRKYIETSQRYQTLMREYELLQSDNDQLRDQCFHWQQQYQQQLHQQGQLQAQAEYSQSLQDQIKQQREALNQAYETQASLQSQVARLEQQSKTEEQQRIQLAHTEERFKEVFENLAQQIFEQKSHSLQESTQHNLHALLSPLRQQLDNFRQQIQQSYDTESRERHSLKTQVEHLNQLNQRMSEEALNLTRALKGDNKQQGNWGEVVLAKVLEESGLRDGHEYHQQVSGKNQQGQTIKPDIVVNLPDERIVIIDSKVTLVAYERYCRSEEEAERKKYLQEHVRSLRQHITGLGRKDYQTLDGNSGLDFVLLFVPIEAAFQLAIEADSGLIQLASRQNIMLVSPSSLLVALRTIENIWRSEYQQRNVVEIAQRAGRLYDKFCGFVESAVQVGNHLEKAQQSHQQAMVQLSQGRGNLVRQAEQLKALQIPTTKELPEEMQNSHTDV